MSERRPVNEVAVDRRDETVVTQHANYASTEHVTRDVAAERRLGSFQLTRVAWTIVGIAESLLGIRFVLKLIAANPDNGFAVLVYRITAPLVAPFTGLVGTPSSGGTVFEVTTLIAMAVYALACWIVTRVLLIVMDRPSARTLTRSVSERTPPGGVSGTETHERTTRTIRP